MKRLLATMDVETFVFDTSTLPETLPSLPGVTLRRVDDHTLEAEMSRAHDLNSLFSALSTHGVIVTSMRNKTNRLEELFVRLVEQGRNGQEKAA
jgi:ABC-2 type transport system ATP-binding protein